MDNPVLIFSGLVCKLPQKPNCFLQVFSLFFPHRTALIGYGIAPADSVSLAIISTIAVGLGVPALFVVLGAIYVIYKKKPWESMQKLVARSNNGYAQLPVTDVD